MTPQEKAQELVLQYEKYACVNTDDAKEGAYIAVNEIIDVCESDKSAIIVQLQYWQEVKTEIENL